MTTHRYFLGNVQLNDTIVIKDKQLLSQWIRVLRYGVGRQVVVFNSDTKEALYCIEHMQKSSISLKKVQDVIPKVSSIDVCLCFSLLKKDKNEWVLQKATELGVSHFMPLVTDRTEKTGWNEDRAKKIVIEASEQCGRADIPKIHEPQSLESALRSLPSKVVKLVAEQSPSNINDQLSTIENPIGIFIGPEGGWSNDEKQLFKLHDIQHVSLSDFTLRAETAAISSVALLTQQGGKK